MTNKINGIDVSECEYINCCSKEAKCIILQDDISSDSQYCESEPNCYFKQLKRLQEENKRLQMLSCANCGEKYLSPDGLELYENNVRLEQQAEAYQLSENEAKEIIAELKHKNKELKEKVNIYENSIVANHDRAVGKRLMEVLLALEEIRNAITESVPKKQGDYNFSKSLNPDKYALLEYIQNKIDEVLK